jgi:two-component system response regulator FixJ
MQPLSIMRAEAPEGRVFIVDDDAAVRQAVTLLVQSLGLRAQAYASAEAFLEAYDPSSDGCLVLDLHMPGMNGVELQQELVARGVRIPVIVITAYKDDPLTVRAQEAGALTVLYKPFKRDILLRSIESALQRH